MLRPYVSPSRTDLLLANQLPARSSPRHTLSTRTPSTHRRRSSGRLTSVPTRRGYLVSTSCERHVPRGAAAVARFKGEGVAADVDAAAATEDQQQAAGGAAVQDTDEDEGLLTHVPVMFELGKHCKFGNCFAIVGDIPELGEWDTSKAVKLQWSEGDIWRASVSVPINQPMSLKYIETGPNNKLVTWGSDIAAGGNITIIITPTDDLISGYLVQTDPQLPTGPNPAQPYLTVRLDVTQLLPMSASFFKEKQLAVSAGLPAAVAEDLTTDRVLVEQGLISEAELEAKWSIEEMNLLRGQYADAALAESLGPSTEELIAATESDVIQQAEDEPTTVEELAAAAAAAAAAEGDDFDADDDIIAATDVDDGLQDIQSDTDDDIIAATDSDVIISAADDDDSSPADDDIIQPPSTPSATAAATNPMHGSSAAATPYEVSTSSPMFDDDSDAAAAASSSSVGSSCATPPAQTKLVSAGPSASSLDIDTPLINPTKAIAELTADGVEPLDPIHVTQGITLPDSSSSSSGESSGAEDDTSNAGPTQVQITTDGTLDVSMRADDPLSLPDAPEVAAVRGAAAVQGFDTEANNIGDQGLLVPREVTSAEEDGTSGAQGIPDVVTPSGAAHEASGLGSHEALLVGPDQAAAMGVKQAEGMTNPDHEAASSSSSSSSSSSNTVASFEDNALAAAVAVAAAASVQYAGKAAAAAEIESDDGNASTATAAAAAAAASVRYAGQEAAAAVKEEISDNGVPGTEKTESEKSNGRKWWQWLFGKSDD